MQPILCTRCGFRKQHLHGLCRRCRKERAEGLETFREVQARMNRALGIQTPVSHAPPTPSEFNVKFSQ